MPVKVPDNLPAKEILKKERIFIMDDSRAFHQDIRPLKILILNLMPLKEATEVDLLRVLSNTPLQIEVTFIHMESHVSKNTATEHLATFYKVFDEISAEKFDGMIITGAPIEQMEFEKVIYWKELTKIMDWTKTNVTSTFHICWGAQAALYYHYGVKKYKVDKKIFGVFKHYEVGEKEDLLRGFDDEYFIPHSRYTEMKYEDIKKIDEVKIISMSDESGVHIVVSKGGKQIFVTGHSEYSRETLKNEYFRDLEKGSDIDIPKNYFKDNDPEKEPIVLWKSHSNILFNNWLNYYVYQETPFDLTEL